MELPPSCSPSWFITLVCHCGVEGAGRAPSPAPRRMNQHRWELLADWSSRCAAARDTLRHTPGHRGSRRNSDTQRHGGLNLPKGLSCKASCFKLKLIYVRSSVCLNLIKVLKSEWFVSGCCGESPVAWSTATVINTYYWLDFFPESLCFIVCWSRTATSWIVMVNHDRGGN